MQDFVKNEFIRLNQKQALNCKRGRRFAITGRKHIIAIIIHQVSSQAATGHPATGHPV